MYLELNLKYFMWPLFIKVAKKRVKHFEGLGVEDRAVDREPL
jgi:hypothetical protein